MACLLDFSHELLHAIFTNIEPSDLGALSRSCSALNSYIQGNRLLCKDLYLQRWDHPSGAKEPCWETELHNVVKLQKLLECEDVEKKRLNLDAVASSIMPLLSPSPSLLNVPFLATHFESQANIDAFLAASSLFTHAGTSNQIPAATKAQRQLSAKLHCLYGVPIDSPRSSSYLEDEINMTRPRSSFHILFPTQSTPASVFPNGPVTRSKTHQVPTNIYARSLVYDLRQYTDGTLWGPFQDDGQATVDWEKVEAIMVVLGYNMRIFTNRAGAGHGVNPIWNSSWQGVAPNSFVSPPPTKIPEELGAPGGLDERDPYGITGMWMRVVCFLDYHDLYAFNFTRSIPADQPRDPIDTREAIRLIKLKLKVTKIEPPGEDDGKDFPVVTFKGTSWSLHASWDANANSKIRGIVRQTPEGEIRWTTWSIFHGEAIQVGGPRSPRGVLGNWFDKDYDDHGPAGPTAFWKINDECTEEDRNIDMAGAGEHDQDTDGSEDESVDEGDDDDEESDDNSEDGEGEASGEEVPRNEVHALLDDAAREIAAEGGEVTYAAVLDRLSRLTDLEETERRVRDGQVPEEFALAMTLAQAFGLPQPESQSSGGGSAAAAAVPGTENEDPPPSSNNMMLLLLANLARRQGGD
ncbi:hypothetical protein MBLNU459_g1981t2 [Dothideomycetes sp. NU459]